MSTSGSQRDSAANCDVYTIFKQEKLFWKYLSGFWSSSADITGWTFCGEFGSRGE
jgi:hypothetical protein